VRLGTSSPASIGRVTIAGVFFTADGSLRRVRVQLATIRELLSAREEHLHVTAVCSGWCPAEHLDHVIKVSASIVNRLLQADAPRSGGVSMLGRIILAAGRIPRGKGKAPERLRGARVSGEELHAALARLEEKIAQLAAEHLAESRGAIVPHPRFGGLRPGQALRFAAVHNDHHLRIIDDILKAPR
jgi:hypothetical protein